MRRCPRCLQSYSNASARVTHECTTADDLGLASGHYDYDVRFTARAVDDQGAELDVTRTVRGMTELLTTTPLAEDGWLGYLDQLVLNEGMTGRLAEQGALAPGGASHVRGDYTAGFYTFDFFGEDPLADLLVHAASEATPTGQWNPGTSGSGLDYLYATVPVTPPLAEPTLKWTIDEAGEGQLVQLFANWAPRLRPRFGPVSPHRAHAGRQQPRAKRRHLHLRRGRPATRPRRPRSRRQPLAQLGLLRGR